MVLKARAHEVAPGVIGPGMEGTSEDQAIALVVAADHLTAVPTRVEKRADLLVFAIAHHNDFFGAHTREHEVAGIRDLALVAQQQPGALEDLLLLLLVNIRVDVQLATDRALLGTDVRP